MHGMGSVIREIDVKNVKKVLNRPLLSKTNAHVESVEPSIATLIIFTRNFITIVFQLSQGWV